MWLMVLVLLLFVFSFVTFVVKSFAILCAVDLFIGQKIAEISITWDRKINLFDDLGEEGLV
jgi:hypothetical protein